MARDRRSTEFLRVHRAANQALFETGFELAGVRLQRFAEGVLAGADASPDASIDELVRGAMEDLEGDAVALVAEEPLLRDYPLGTPVHSVSEAAEPALCALAHRLLDVRVVQPR